MLSSVAEELITQAIKENTPSAWERNRDDVERIEQAATPDALLGLAPRAAGMVRKAWLQRAQEFGPEIVPLMADRLRHTHEIDGQDAQTRASETLIAALYRQGDTGSRALLDCFDELDDYGKSVASVALGLLGTQESADTLWAFYQRSKERPEKRYFIGPLWGLVDLGDSRAADALAEILWAACYFYEIFAMAHRAGDARAILPLVYAVLQGTAEMKEHAAHALCSVAHRIGRAALRDALQALGSQTNLPQESRESLADRILSNDPRWAEEYFAPFYEGISPEAVVPEEISARLALYEFVKENPDVIQPAARPGRNDPCWCGSGKKYKHCHWLQDRRANP